jgi:hypothetical protein
VPSSEKWRLGGGGGALEVHSVRLNNTTKQFQWQRCETRTDEARVSKPGRHYWHGADRGPGLITPVGAGLSGSRTAVQLRVAFMVIERGVKASFAVLYVCVGA